MTDSPGPDALAEQRERLVELRGREAELARLRADAASVEVESMAAEVAVQAGRARGRPQVSPEKAAEVTAALARVRAGTPAEPAPALYDRAHLEVALGALRDWLEAPQHRTAPGRTELVLRLIVLALLLAAVWAAVKIHLAFLLLVPPIAVPFTMLARSGDDVRWRRMGARRHFERTNLAPPAGWDEASVRARCEELEAAAHRLRSAPGVPAAAPDVVEDELDDEGGDEAEAGARLAGLLHELRIAGGTTGVDLAPDLEEWLGTLARSYRARRALEELSARRAAAEREAGAAREALFRFLARHGEAPPGGRAETEALAAGLTRLERRARA